MNRSEDDAAPDLIENRRRPSGQVRSPALFEVKGKLGMSQQVGIPAAGSWWSARDVQLPVDIVESYLDAMELSGLPSCSSDIDEVIMR